MRPSAIHPLALSLVTVLAISSPARAQEVEAAVAVAPSPIILVLPAVAAPDAECAPEQEPVDPATLEVREHAAAPEDADAGPAAAPELLTPRPFRLGLSSLVGTLDTPHGLDATWIAGLDVGLRVTPREDAFFFLDVSLRRITVGGTGTLAGERWAIGASPAVSVGGRVAERVEIYAEGGAAIQNRFGGQAGSSVGVAPFAGGGVRVYFLDWLSLAVEGAMHVVATRGLLLGMQVFPQASVIFQGGLALAFHIG